MRLVVDTNVFVSAALKEASWPGKVVRWIEKFGGLLKTRVIEQEVIAVLQRPRIAPKIAPLFLKNLRLLLADAELVAIIEAVTGSRDPDDDNFTVTCHGRRGCGSDPVAGAPTLLSGAFRMPSGAV